VKKQHSIYWDELRGYPSKNDKKDAKVKELPTLDEVLTKLGDLRSKIEKQSFFDLSKEVDYIHSLQDSIFFIEKDYIQAAKDAFKKNNISDSKIIYKIFKIFSQGHFNKHELLANYYLSLYYKKGFGYDKNEEKALEHIITAAKRGNHGAKKVLKKRNIKWD
ncbi:34469_t:CDS:1, partial [Racocetra persica]